MVVLLEKKVICECSVLSWGSICLGARRRIPAHIKVSLDEQDTSGSKLLETILM